MYSGRKSQNGKLFLGVVIGFAVAKLGLVEMAWNKIQALRTSLPTSLNEQNA